MYLNKAMIIGNLTRDPELKSLHLVLKFAIFFLLRQTEFGMTKKRQTRVNRLSQCCGFRSNSRNCCSIHEKGSSILVEGRMQTRSWDADGGKNIVQKLLADTVQFGPRSSGGGDYSGGSRNAENDSPKKSKLQSLKL